MENHEKEPPLETRGKVMKRLELVKEHGKITHTASHVSWFLEERFSKAGVFSYILIIGFNASLQSMLMFAHNANKIYITARIVIK